MNSFLGFWWCQNCREIGFNPKNKGSSLTPPMLSSGKFRIENDVTIHNPQSAHCSDGRRFFTIVELGLKQTCSLPNAWDRPHWLNGRDLVGLVGPSPSHHSEPQAQLQLLYLRTSYQFLLCCRKERDIFLSIHPHPPHTHKHTNIG
jgi:hypothetical protein